MNFFIFLKAFYILFRIISEWRIFKMKKKIVTLFIVLLIAIGAFVILKPIYAASASYSGDRFHHEDCDQHSDNQDCPNRNDQNCSRKMKRTHQMNQDCVETHQSQYKHNHDCVSQVEQNCAWTVNTHHQMHHK
jgi:peptidoglycan hydrolase CwlO-like protein